MNSLKYESLISSQKTTPTQIQQLAHKVQQVTVPQRLKLLLFLQHSLGHQSTPQAQLNAALLLMNLLQQGKSWEVSLVECAFLDGFKEPALIAAAGSNAKLYDYFENKGYRTVLVNLQTLSYHFTQTCLTICLFVSYAKPKKLYRNKQLNITSIGKSLEAQLRQGGLDEHTVQSIASRHNFSSLKKVFVGNVIAFHKDPHEYINFFMDQVETYLLTGVDSTFYRWYKTLALQGDVYLSSESLARSAQIICFHKHFSVRRNALQLLSDFVFWGDLEALLMINYTQYFKAIGSKVMQAQDRFNKTGIFCLFPEIEGQVKEKQLFLNEFLLFVLRLATLFPTLEAYFIDSGQSPLYQLYVYLLEKQIRFPVWKDQEHFQLKVFKNFKDKKERNNTFLEELDRQRRQVSMMLNPLRPTMRQLATYCQKNSENLSKFLVCKDLNTMQWVQLVEFRKVYEDYLERMVEQNEERELNNLIEDCLQLDSRIENIEEMSYKLKEGKISRQEFRQKLDDQTPKFRQQDFSDKASSIREILKNKGKNNNNYTLTPSAEAVKDKLSAKMMKLAYKRGDQVGQVSQLELYSRPFLANNIHGKDIMNDFMPILHLHPERKEKRNRKGLKLLAGDEDDMWDRLVGTPRFQSEVKPKQKVRGIKLVPQQNKIYDKYLSYLDDEQIRKFMVRSPIKIIESDKWIIKRGQLIGEDLRLQTIFYCICPGDITSMEHHINEQPWLDISSTFLKKEKSQVEIKVTAVFTKFGFRIPTIEFIFNQQRIKTPLPFVFHNFLTVKPIKPVVHSRSKQWSIPHSLRPNFHNMVQIANQLKGLQQEGEQALGRVCLGPWESNLRLQIEKGRLLVSTESKKDEEDNVLHELLPKLAIHLYTTWREAPSQ